MFWRDGVSSEMLAELRAIRGEIHDLTEKVGLAATREDLKGYVTQEVFDAAQAEHRRRVEGWRGWLPIWISAAALLLNLLQHVRVS